MYTTSIGIIDKKEFKSGMIKKTTMRKPNDSESESNSESVRCLNHHDTTDTNV